MYKGASEAMQHRHGIGYIAAGHEPTDALPEIARLTVDEAKAERDQLRIEIRRTEQDIAVAIATQRKKDKAALGQRKAVLCARLSLINAHIRERDSGNELRRLGQAIRQIAPEQADAIFERAKALRKEIEDIADG